MPAERCGMPCNKDGDWLECSLEFNHDGGCHHDAFAASLAERTRQAQGPWL
jgi:hypothetical protein